MKTKLLLIIIILTTLQALATGGTTTSQTVGLKNWKPPMPIAPLTTDCRIGSVGVNTTTTNPNFDFSNFTISLGYFKYLQNHFGISICGEYMQQANAFGTPAVGNYGYKNLHVPAVLHIVPAKYLYLGVGAQYSYLLGATFRGQNVTLANNTDYQRHGVGIIGDVSVGWAERSPKLGLRYIYNIGAARNNQTYSTLDLSLRVPF